VAAKPASDLGLGGIVIGKGQARGIDPQQAIGEQTQQPRPVEQSPAPASQQVATTIEGTASNITSRQVQSPGQGSPTHPGGLPFAMRPSEAMPVRNVQVRIPEPIADLLKVMALYERTSQQLIMERAITEVVREWQANYERERGRAI
jgi:hypothetical protein